MGSDLLLCSTHEGHYNDTWDKPNWFLKSGETGQRGRQGPRVDKEPWPRQLGDLRP